MHKNPLAMRYFPTAICLVLLTAGCKKQPDVVLLDSPVSSFANLPETYQPVQGATVSNRLKSETQDGKPSGEWRYNERGQLLEWRRLRFGGLESVDQYRYDADGHLRFVQRFDNSCGYSSASNCTGPVKWTGYDDLTTDAAGRVTESRVYLNVDGKWDLRSINEYTHNPQDQLIEVRQADATGKATRTQTMTYDSRGNVTSVREQSPIASPDLADRTITYTYETGRSPYFKTVYYASALFLSPNIQVSPEYTYEYRSDGLPIRIRHSKGGTTELTYY